MTDWVISHAAEAAIIRRGAEGFRGTLAFADPGGALTIVAVHDEGYTFAAQVPLPLGVELPLGMLEFPGADAAEAVEALRDELRRRRRALN